jgi:hypothetical protein
MNSMFRFGGWFFLLVGLSLIIFNLDSLSSWWNDEDSGEGYLGLTPFIIGVGQAILGVFLIRLSAFMGKGGIGDGLLQREKLEQRILEMESRGMDTSRYRKILDKMDGKEL